MADVSFDTFWGLLETKDKRLKLVEYFCNFSFLDKINGKWENDNSETQETQRSAVINNL